jgi:hypothetical protein
MTGASSALELPFHAHRPVGSTPSRVSSPSLTKWRLKRGVFQGVVDLQGAINRFVADHNEQPKPFVWTADPDKIIAAANRGHQVLDTIH